MAAKACTSKAGRERGATLTAAEPEDPPPPSYFADLSLSRVQHPVLAVPASFSLPSELRVGELSVVLLAGSRSNPPPLLASSPELAPRAPSPANTVLL